MKNFLIISSVFILPFASGIYILKDQLEKKFNKKNSEIDNTRFGVQNYGMKWGAKTDEIVIILCILIFYFDICFIFIV